ncbi:FliC/FljB family flagellin [Alcaligenes nematophilus]|uniref:FliC/FljB family flagellin n=1 Tax=Alcaligenes nematophilus TaxID=2994643 RepID=UPI0034E0B304
MSVINTNYLALVSQNNLTKSQNSLGTAIERLSSGLRINSAKDDAAGQAIANRFTANINGLSQASRNANDGISVAQTTEGALNEINENLQRIRTLTVQATTGSNSKTDLDSIQAEIDQRLGEINRVAEQTQFNGVKVLASDQTLTVQVGANDNETISINLQQINRGSLGLDTLDASKFGRSVKEGDFVSVATETKNPAVMGQTFAFDGVDAGSEVFEIDNQYYVRDAAAGNAVYAATLSGNAANGEVTVKSNGPAITGSALTALDLDNQTALAATNYEISPETVDGQNTGKAVLDATGLTAGNTNSIVESEGKHYIRSTDANGNDTYYNAKGTYDADAKTVTFEIDGAALTGTDLPDAVALNPLSSIDKALQQVDNLRSDLGAIQNRFQSTIANLNNTVNNLSAARSRIEDADYAVEVSNMTRSQILQQAGTSVLAQANQVPQTVLSLLR